MPVHGSGLRGVLGQSTVSAAVAERHNYINNDRPGLGSLACSPLSGVHRWAQMLLVFHTAKHELRAFIAGIVNNVSPHLPVV